MNLQMFYEHNQTEEGINEIFTIWRKIRHQYYEKPYVYLQWLVLRILLAFGGFLNDLSTLTNLKLDNEDFTPLYCAPANERDHFVEYQEGKGWVIEVTQRPIHGYIEHYSHITKTKEEFDLDSASGCLVTEQKLKEVPGGTWNSYKGRWDREEPSFVICDVDFLIKLLKKEQEAPVDVFKRFLQVSKQIWKKEESWEEVKEKIISLKQQLLGRR